MEEQENIVCLKFRRHVNSNIGLNFFIRKVINNCNQLTDKVFSCKSLSTFKLNEFLTAKGKFKCIAIWLIHDSFPLLLLFLYNQVFGQG